MLEARDGDIICYYRTGKGVSINPHEIGIGKYKEMLMSSVKPALEVQGYGSSKKIEPIFGITHCIEE